MIGSSEPEKIYVSGVTFQRSKPDTLTHANLSATIIGFHWSYIHGLVEKKPELTISNHLLRKKGPFFFFFLGEQN